ncbi:MAG: homoserine kinase [Chloroflexi bacterium]|nr:homoserine kinase [Chloroflexota bacterium]
MPRDYVTVHVPATTANLGPGFDCLGLALDLQNTVTVERSGQRLIEIAGEGEKELSRQTDNWVYQGMAALCKRIEQTVPPVRIICHNRIPLSRGLGSSAAAALSGVLASNALCDDALPQRELLLLAAALDGHPDNVAPALLGGCQIVVQDDEQGLVTAPVPVPPELRAVLFLPDFAMPTAQARAVLPVLINRQDAVFNIGRTALLVSSLFTGKLEALRLATQDRLHQRPRQVLFPAMPKLLQAALDAGAFGAFLSGAGSSIIALAGSDGQAQAVGQALQASAQDNEVAGSWRVLLPAARGAQVLAQ